MQFKTIKSQISKLLLSFQSILTPVNRILLQHCNGFTEFPDFVYAPVKSPKNKYIFNKIQKFVYQNFLQYFVFKTL